MHIRQEELKPTEIKLTISADPEELTKAKGRVLKRLTPQVNVPGFRAGKVPMAIAEKHLDPQQLQAEVIEDLVQRLYSSAVTQENIRPVANPEVEITKFVPFTTLEFTAVIQAVGTIKLADYRKLRVTRKDVKISKEDVDNVVASLQLRAAERKEVSRAAQSEDQVTIDFSGTDTKGKPVQGAEGTDYPLVLGSNSFIPGFEDSLIGIKVDETKTFPVTFPADYGVKALQKKKVTFSVTAKKIESIEKPALDDAFAAAVGPFKDMTELRADIKKQIEIERRRDAETQYENELLEKLANASTIELPDMLIEEQIDRIEQEEKQNLLYRGQTFEEHLKEEGVTAEEHRDQKRPAAEQRVKIGIILAEVADAEAITATPEEVEVRLQLLKNQYKDAAAQAELTKPEVLRDLKTRIITEKTLEKLKSYAGAQ